MTNPKVYIHELIEITGHNRAAYMHHMTANWGPIGRTERNMLCVGVWATVGSTERWPETVNLWELDGWHGLAANFRHEFTGPKLQDPSLQRWWAEAANYRRGGYDRILVPAPYTPTIEEALERGIHGEVYSHEVVQVVPGQARTYLSMLEQDWMPVASRLGLQLLGAYRTAMVNDSEVIVISAIDTWERWADIAAAYDDDTSVGRWRRRIADVVVDWRGKLLVDSELNPLKTGQIL
ncbi:MAG TPA: NIPSNAP family containing protein [Acidimicrobiia bacterium]|nr:NIPSNAP family containing protein [Acidimicrobiia bacterium]